MRTLNARAAVVVATLVLLAEAAGETHRLRATLTGTQVDCALDDAFTFSAFNAQVAFDWIVVYALAD